MHIVFPSGPGKKKKNRCSAKKNKRHGKSLFQSSPQFPNNACLNERANINQAVPSKPFSTALAPVTASQPQEELLCSTLEVLVRLIFGKPLLWLGATAQ